jgi:hypothetical protein
MTMLCLLMRDDKGEVFDFFVLCILNKCFTICSVPRAGMGMWREL